MDPTVLAAIVAATSAIGVALVAEVGRRWLSKREKKTASAEADKFSAEAEATQLESYTAAFKELAEELKSQAKSWKEEANRLSGELIAARAQIEALSKELKQFGMERHELRNRLMGIEGALKEETETTAELIRILEENNIPVPEVIEVKVAKTKKNEKPEKTSDLENKD